MNAGETMLHYFNGRIPKLNFDILLCIMSFSPCSTMSRMMQTCRELNVHGDKYLLRSDAQLQSASGMISFISFMTTSKWGNRFRHSIRLFIWGPPLNDTAKLFADFLRRHSATQYRSEVLLPKHRAKRRKLPPVKHRPFLRPLQPVPHRLPISWTGEKTWFDNAAEWPLH